MKLIVRLGPAWPLVLLLQRRLLLFRTYGFPEQRGQRASRGEALARRGETASRRFEERSVIFLRHFSERVARGRSTSDNPLYIQKRLKFGVLVLVFANIFMANLLINIDHGVVPAATTRLK